MIYVPRTQAEVDQLTGIVKHAVGFDEKRGDAVEVKTAEFARPVAIAGEDAGKPVPAWQKWIPYAAAALAGLVVLSTLVLVWRGRAKKSRVKPGATLQALRAAPLMAEPALTTMDQPRAALSQTTAESDDRRAQALELAMKDPATAAIVIKKWLSAPATPAAPAR